MFKFLVPNAALLFCLFLVSISHSAFAQQSRAQQSRIDQYYFEVSLPADDSDDMLSGLSALTALSEDRIKGRLELMGTIEGDSVKGGSVNLVTVVGTLRMHELQLPSANGIEINSMKQRQPQRKIQCVAEKRNCVLSDFEIVLNGQDIDLRATLTLWNSAFSKSEKIEIVLQSQFDPSGPIQMPGLKTQLSKPESGLEVVWRL